jgi:hypothetical protein
VNRDPIEEKGDFNMYRMAGNNTVEFFDVLGLIADNSAMPFSDGMSGRSFTGDIHVCRVFGKLPICNITDPERIANAKKIKSDFLAEAMLGNKKRTKYLCDLLNRNWSK